MKNKLTEIEMAIIRKKAKCHDWNWDKIASSFGISNVRMVNIAKRLIDLGYTLLKPQNNTIDLVKSAIDEHIFDVVKNVSANHKEYAIESLAYSVMCIEKSLRRLYKSQKLKRNPMSSKAQQRGKGIFALIDAGNSMDQVADKIGIPYYTLLNFLASVIGCDDVPKAVVKAYESTIEKAQQSAVINKIKSKSIDCFKPNYTPPPVQKTPFPGRRYAPIKPKYARQEEIILAYFERSIDECLRALYAEQYFLSIEEIEQIHQQLKNAKNAKRQS